MSKTTTLSFTQVMQALEAEGTAQNRKIYGRHGVKEPMFGVSYAYLKKLVKRVAEDQELAQRLWQTGNHDARVFACWIAEPEKVTAKQLDDWSRDVDNHVLANELAGLASFTKLGASRSAKWRKLKSEFRSAMGWSIVAKLATLPDLDPRDGGMTDAELNACLKVIEAEIHAAANRTAHAMNGALIAVGCRPSTSKAALAVAKRIGKVDTDHGETSCKTPVALDAIKKSLAHYKARGKTPVDGAAGKRRRHC